MKAVFMGSPVPAEPHSPSIQRRVAMFKRVISHFHTGLLSGKKATDCLSQILVKADQLPGEVFPPLIDLALRAIASRSDAEEGMDVDGADAGAAPEMHGLASLPHVAARRRLGASASRADADSARATVLEVIPKFMSRIDDSALLPSLGLRGSACVAAVRRCVAVVCCMD